MPDRIYFGELEYKIGWYSCVWVDPSKRGKGIAKELVNVSLKDWQNRIVLGDPVKESKALYLQTGMFTDLVRQTGLRGYLKFSSAESLARKHPLFKKLTPLLKVLDGLLNIPNALRISLWKAASTKLPDDFEYVSEPDQEVENLIAACNSTDLSRRRS